MVFHLGWATVQNQTHRIPTDTTDFTDIHQSSQCCLELFWRKYSKFSLSDLVLLCLTEKAENACQLFSLPSTPTHCEGCFWKYFNMYGFLFNGINNSIITVESSYHLRWFWEIYIIKKSDSAVFAKLICLGILVMFVRVLWITYPQVLISRMYLMGV